MTDKEIIKKMMEKTNQELLQERRTFLEYEEFQGDGIISFDFDKNGNLLRITYEGY
jgi:hypothetical protein